MCKTYQRKYHWHSDVANVSRAMKLKPWHAVKWRELYVSVTTFCVLNVATIATSNYIHTILKDKYL